MRARAQSFVALVSLLACCGCAFALDPSLDISQYAHTVWKIREGFSRGYIHSIAQTRDGYLWLGTDFGLLRFDGVKSVPWQPPRDQRHPSGKTISLLAARDGTLWIGTAKGLTSWKEGTLTEYSELAGQVIWALLEDREGTVWVGGMGLPGRLCAIQNGNVHCSGEDGTLGSGVSKLYEDSKGNLWATTNTGLWRWKPGTAQFYPLPGEPSSLTGLAEDNDGRILITLRSGVGRLVNGKIEAYKLPGTVQQFEPRRLLRDRDAGLWIGTSDRGVLHVHEGRTDVFGSSDGCSGDDVSDFFEDREGNIWAGTKDGLDRFREFAVATFTARQGLSNSLVLSVLAANDGNVWLGADGSLDRWKNGRIATYIDRDGKPDGLAPNSLFQDSRGRIWVSTRNGLGYLKEGRFIAVAGIPGGWVHGIAEDAADDLWIANEDLGLFRLRQGSMVQQIPWAGLGHRDAAQVLAADPSRGNLWLGFRNGGVDYFADGGVRASYTVADGLGNGRVNSLRVVRDGTLWAATEGGLSRLKDDHFATLASKNGLPCDSVHWMIEDDEGSFWLYMPCGLVRISRSEIDAWATAVDKGKETNRTILSTFFDSSDGVRTLAEIGNYSPQVAKTWDGRIWFLPWDGVSVIDPRHLPVNKLPPPVHIEQVTADGKTYDLSHGLRPLPARIRDLVIDYTALSFVAPEKVHFRVKLEGQDKDWRELTDRHVEYTNLPPKHYKFRVLACNNSGVWNEEGAALDFVIPPAWYQTNWFRGACIAAFLMMIWGIHELRVRQLAAQFNMRLEERVAERTRIARDLHDTLLQSFQGLLLQFKAISYRMQPGEIKKSLDAAIGEASQAVTEGRDTVQGLRTSVVQERDLAKAIRAFGDELASSAINQSPVAFEVVVEGRRKRKRPFLRDEIYRIAIEALRNAFRHAQADRIEVELQYGDKAFTLRVRDNGRGIDRDVLSSEGRKGHFGLHGMRERAELAGGELAIWSEVDSGTEIELTIPASRAYLKPPRRPWFRNLSQKDSDRKEKSAL